MVLGGLLKALKALGLFPLPIPPFLGLSIQTLSERLRRMRVPTLCEKLKILNNRSFYSSPGRPLKEVSTCGINAKIQGKVEELEEGLRGLDLHGELIIELAEKDENYQIKTEH
jgi:hypothetical protein